MGTGGQQGGQPNDPNKPTPAPKPGGDNRPGGPVPKQPGGDYRPGGDNRPDRDADEKSKDYSDANR